MSITVHHQPAGAAVPWSMRVWQSAWDGNNVWDNQGTPNGILADLQLPDVPDPRLLQFKFHSTSAAGVDFWEPDSFIRRLFLTTPAEIWTFDSSPRILYQDPFPAGVAFQPGDVLSFQVITQQAFRGGQIYVWDPYNANHPAAFFPELARDDASSISTFQVTLTAWMTAGFHLKLMNAHSGAWEPDAGNRVWRPCDGAALWLKSGQCDVRSTPLSLTAVALEVLYSAQMPAAPQLTLTDLAEGSSFPVNAPAITPYPPSPLFNVASYGVSLYPQAAYSIAAQAVENSPIPRPFPADPTVPGAVSRFALGASAWLAAFPAVATIPLSIQPQPASSFTGGVSAQVSVGNSPPYQTVPAVLQPGGDWQAGLHLLPDTTTCVNLLPALGVEPKPYDAIDTRRFFAAPAGTPLLYTTEKLFGIAALRPTLVAEPPSRAAIMQAAFGAAVAGCGIFAGREMPHGATILGGDVYFAVHAPHAICASLILVDEIPPGNPSRHLIPMTVTQDTFYWWCSVPAAQAPPGSRYRFLLNDDVEVLDPAARAVQDGVNLKTAFGESPADPSTSWSVVVDTNAIFAQAHAQPWQTMGWQNFLIYEIHARRFSNLSQGALTPFGLLADELNQTNRLGKPGYLSRLPVTVFGLMPVNEFSNAVSWGYDPSYYFAIDSYYGGSPALAGFVNAAHAAGRGVTLDVVYNHSLGSSLMTIAADVYRNGDYDGDRMNCGHPMVNEYFRQASVYLFRTFNLDGFRFDDTQTIVTKCNGGWEFLGMIRASLRAAASAEGRAWPYLVAENSATSPWDISSPSAGVMDGQWDIDEVYAIRAASYDTRNAGSNDAVPLQTEMNNPAYWGRPFFQATRFGESHDMVSAQDLANQRIAARPPFGQGYQMAKALGSVTLLSNGVPMLFMGQEIGETVAFSFNDNDQWINPQQFLDPQAASDNSRILAWFTALMGLRNDPSKGLQGDANYQVISTGNRTVAFTCGSSQTLFAVVTFGTANQQQDSGWLGLPSGVTYKEIFNSSWPAFQVELEPEHTNGGYTAQIHSGQILNLPYIGAVVLERY